MKNFHNFVKEFTDLSTLLKFTNKQIFDFEIKTRILDLELTQKEQQKETEQNEENKNTDHQSSIPIEEHLEDLRKLYKKLFPNEQSNFQVKEKKKKI